MKLQDFLYHYRAEHRLSMEEFAARCGLTKGAISIIESGKNPRTGRPLYPRLETLRHLAAGMDMTLEELLRSTDSFSIDLHSDATPSRETQLLLLFRKLNEAGQDKLIDSAQDLVMSGRYIYKAAVKDR